MKEITLTINADRLKGKKVTPFLKFVRLMVLMCRLFVTLMD